MNLFEIFNLIPLLVWWGMMATPLYLVGYENGERAGRAAGCRCWGAEGECPCKPKEGE